MKTHRLLLTVALAVLLTGCTAEPAPTPEPDTAAPAPSASAAAQYEKPQSAFDIGCAEISAPLSAFTGAPEDAVVEALGFVSGPNWHAGPPQMIAPRAGGVACSYAGEMSDDGTLSGWRVMITPRAQSTVDALTAAGYSDLTTACHEGSCSLFVQSGDALLSGAIVANGITSDDTGEVAAFAQELVERAAQSQKTDAAVVPSALAGAECIDLLSPEQLSSLWDVQAEVQDEFGGWSVESEVYFTVDGGAHCSYTSNAGSYDAEGYASITDLPGGAWALPHEDAQKEIVIDGADGAWVGFDALNEGVPVIDLDINGDWVRLAGSEDGQERDLAAVAAVIAQNVAALD